MTVSLDKIYGVLITVTDKEGRVFTPAYEAHSMEKVYEIVKATWAMENVSHLEYEVY